MTVTDKADLHEMRERATAFGAVAKRYDQARPTYPDALVRELLMTNPHDVLDVGCGTGKACRLFAAQGCTVLGVEPDAAMAAVAREYGLQVEIGTFEPWDDAGRRFDLLISGQAWHWVEPDEGARKARSVLRSGGRVGLFWNMDHFDAELRARFDEVYEREAPALASKNRQYGGNRHGRREAVERGLADAGFLDVGVHDYSWQRHYDRDQYVALLGTFSDHILLPDEQRERLFTALGDIVGERGGIAAPYDTHLITAVAP